MKPVRSGGFSPVAAFIDSEMPGLFTVCRENSKSRERDGRAGWNSAEWARFIAAARDPRAHASTDGIVMRLLATALLRTVSAVETMQADHFNDEKIRQVLVLRKQHEGGLVDEHRRKMNERPLVGRRRAPEETNDD